MPDRSSRLTLARQWQLLRRLPARPPGSTARQLTMALADSGFPTSKRTIERDLAILERVFPIRCNDKGRPYGWYWMRDADLGIPGVDLAEALSLTILENFLRRTLPLSLWRAFEPRLAHASKKLHALTDSNRAAQWPEKIRYVSPTLPLVPPIIHPSVLDNVQQALLNNRQLEVAYRDFEDSQAASLTLHPLGLIQHGPVPYLVATKSGDEDARFFALNRIQTVEIRREPATRPDGFSLDSCMDADDTRFVTDAERHQITLEARVAPELYRILTETPLSHDQELRSGERDNVVTATVPDNSQLRCWILSQGERIEVTAPTKLRRELAEQVRTLHSVYVS